MDNRPRVLFCVRSKIDLERYQSIARHIRIHSTVIWAHFSLHAAQKININGQLRIENEVDESFTTYGYSAEKLKLLLRKINADIIVMDQFGPSANELYKKLPMLARDIGVLSCMIPHGIPTIYPTPYTGHKVPEHVADVVFFTNELHYNHAISFYGINGVYTSIMGDPRFDIENISIHPTRKTGTSDSIANMVNIGLFESNIPSYLSSERTNLQKEFTNTIKKLENCILKVRTHPRLGGQKNKISSLQLIQWSDIVSTISSSAVFEGLYLDKCAYVLDVNSFSRGKCKSLFTSFPSEKISNQCSLPILKINPDKYAFQNACWGGLSCGNVARKYASTLMNITESDMSSLNKL